MTNANEQTRVRIHQVGRIALPREQRKAALSDAFSKLAEVFEPAGARLDWDSLSTSGQTVEVLLPASKLEFIANEARSRGFRIDPVRLQQIVPPF